MTSARKSVLFVRMFDEERAMLRKIATHVGLTESEMVRQLVRDRAGEPSMLRGESGGSVPTTKREA